MDDGWGLRQNLSWRWGYSRAKSGKPYSCPWWADEQAYGLAFLQGKGVDMPRDPHGRKSPAGGDTGGVDSHNAK